jgi:neutral ceramidase
MKVGFAERDITPSPGMERPGGYSKSFHNDNVHDPCKIRVSVFDDGQNRVALVGIDTLAVPKVLIQNARNGIEKACGISANAILVGASHSHSAGPLSMVLPGQFDHASPLAQHLAYEISSCADPKYMEIVERELISAVVEANDKRIDAKCGIGSGREDKVAFNRRFLMKNGITCTHPGKCNPDIEKPAGPADSEVGVIGAWDTEGKLIGCVVNFACHGTTGPGSTSADWIYYLEKTIRSMMGDQAIVVFLNGACGDITQVDNLSPYNIDFGERAARYVGTRVGAEAVKVLITAEPGDLTPVSANIKNLRIPRRKPSDARLERALEIVKHDPSQVDSTEWTFAKEVIMLDALIQKEPVVDVEVQAVQVGPAVFMANPSEFFCQFGLDLKAKSIFPFTFPVELANDCIGYVPTEEAMGEHGGGYETRLTAYSNLEVDAGDKIVNALLDLANGLTPGDVPEPPKIDPINARWTYGNVPPEVS